MSGDRHLGPHLAFPTIRFLTDASHDGQSVEAVDQRRERANEIADIGRRGLTASLEPRLRDGPSSTVPVLPRLDLR